MMHNTIQIIEAKKNEIKFEEKRNSIFMKNKKQKIRKTVKWSSHSKVKNSERKGEIQEKSTNMKAFDGKDVEENSRKERKKKILNENVLMEFLLMSFLGGVVIPPRRSLFRKSI